MLRSLATLTLTVLTAVVPALPAAPQTPAPAAATPTPEPTYVTEKGFKSRVFEVRNRDPYTLQDTIRPLGSGFRGALISSNRDLGTITVRDFPENLAAIEEALKRLDTPEARQPDVQLRLYVLLGSPFPASGPPSEELKDVIASLRSTLTYKGYELVGTFEQRVKDGTRNVEGSGITESEPANAKGERETMQAEYSISRVTLAEGPAATSPPTVRLSGFSFNLTGRGRAKITTDLSIRDGEKVVVGTTTLRDRALVLVLVAHVVK